MIDFESALALVLAEARPLEPETVPIDAVAGRVLAEDLTARGDAPQTAVSTMDGYAVREVDLATLPARLPLATVIFPGHGDLPVLPPGTCARVFTGAPVPEGADRVVAQECVDRDGHHALFGSDPGPARFIRAAGSDFRAGETLLTAGTVLGYRAMVAAAAADVASLQVHRRPRVAVLGTGDELVEPGQALETPGAIPDSVTRAIAALARESGAEIVSRRGLGDTPAVLEAAAGDALDEADLVVVTGGASVGERDFARAMFERFDLDLIFSKVAMKPGKPVWLGRARGRLILGLPGNPGSAMVTGRLFLAPLVAGLAGRDPAALLDWRDLPLTGPMPPCGDRETFERGRRIEGGVAILAARESGDQKALAAADVLIRRSPGAPALEAGQTVSILPF
ncbi:MAG: molybdopterin molybdotransferase MoeA [Brevundimonas sp.]|uniref:molybdopterin molybdotransferase MoeA n=1 Tax=Brevundimonas sp. TaxID=1871086 RepID=UPI002733B8D0|nr:molybdopterin molybdotransferase MoeA [Brevundimonas sp.]MDP3406292.1 molybdopterin molybdotransferase MoeA [Brevundimonas sp.]